MSYRYIGNKARLLPSLVQMIEDRVPAGARVADPMCGTASVAAALAERGYRVYASDVMTYAYLHARVRLTLGRAPRFREFGGYEQVLSTLNGLHGVQGYYSREYGPAGTPENGVKPRQYFSAENAAKLDAIAITLRRWWKDDALTAAEWALLRHDLVLAANRVANIAGTFGHFRSKWSPSALAPIRLTATEFAASASQAHIARQGPVEQLAATISADLCYLDPPYTKRQYAANYHLPETIARCDEPEAIGVSGLRPWRDQYSDFCSKLRVRDSFRAIIETMDCPRFLISYSEDGLLSRSDLETFFSEFGAVSVQEIQAKRFRSQKRDPRSPMVTEFVFDLVKG